MRRGEVEQIKVYTVSLEDGEIRLVVRGLVRLLASYRGGARAQVYDLAQSLGELVGEKVEEPKEPEEPEEPEEPVGVVASVSPLVAQDRYRPPSGHNAVKDGPFKGMFPMQKVTCSDCKREGKVFAVKDAWPSPIRCDTCAQSVPKGYEGYPRLGHCEGCGRNAYAETSFKKHFKLPDLCQRCARLTEPETTPTGEAAAPSEPPFPLRGSVAAVEGSVAPSFPEAGATDATASLPCTVGADASDDGGDAPASDLVGAAAAPEVVAVCRKCSYHETSPGQAILWPEPDLCKTCARRIEEAKHNGLKNGLRAATPLLTGADTAAMLLPEPMTRAVEKFNEHRHTLKNVVRLAAVKYGIRGDMPQVLADLLDTLEPLRDTVHGKPIVDRALEMLQAGARYRDVAEMVEERMPKPKNPVSKKREFTSKTANNWREKHAALMARRKGGSRIEPPK